MLQRSRQSLFRDQDQPLELWARDRGYPKWLRQHCLRPIDDLLRPDMDPILLARSLYGKSMLHPDALLELYRCARACRGAIVEIGPFKGGGTIMMANGRRSAGNDAPIVTIEVGGENLNRHMPTDDVIRDLRANLADYGVADRVSVVEGWSNQVIDQVERELGGHRIGMLVVDADGEVRRDFDLYRRLLAPGATIAVDDYQVPEPNIKQAIVFAAVEKMVAEGLIRKTRLVPWGTWFGTYTG